MRKHHYKAAGGILVHNGKVLLLDRPSRKEVRLPKGHIEEGESAAEAALREVREESGYRNLRIVADLGVQRVSFFDPYRRREVMRDEHYFLMCLQDVQITYRREKEHQFRPVWVPITDAVGRLSYQSEQQFVERAVIWMEENEAETWLQ